MSLKVNRETDLQVITWLIKFWVVWFLIARVIWKTETVRSFVAEYYSPMLARSLAFLVDIFGPPASVSGSTVYVEGSRLAFLITPDCTGLYGGLFFFLAAVLTLPAYSQIARFLWLFGGWLVLASANLARLTALILVSTDVPGRFDQIHEMSDVFNMIVGCALIFLAAWHLSLKPRGIKPFRRG